MTAWPSSATAVVALRRLGGSGRSLRTPVLLVGYMAVSLAIAHGSLYMQGLLLVAAIFGILALSLDLAAGMAGLYSLGHAGLFAFGAYGSTVLASHGVGVFETLPIAVLGVGIIGLVLGALALRVSGLYFAVTTFVFTLVVSVIASQLTITGGPQGLLGPLFPAFPAAWQQLGSSTAWCVMLCLLAAIAFTWSIRQSPLYPVLLSIRDAEPFAASAGVRTGAVKVGVLAMSAGLAGLAGWAFAFLGVVSPGQFQWPVSVNILVMVLFGGINTRIGPLIGAAVISIFPAYVNISPLWQEVVFGALFLVIVVFFPQGVMGCLASLWRMALEAARREPSSGRPDAGPPGGRTGVPVMALAGGAAAEASKAVESDPAPGQGNNLNGLNTNQAPTPAVECRGIHFHYTRGVKVLDGVDFTVRPGTIHGLIGPNGSGKSTLVDLIAGRIKPEAGTIRLNQRQAERFGPAHRVKFGVTRTFQSAVLVDELPAVDNVLVGLYSTVRAIAARGPIWPVLPGARRDLRTMRSRSVDVLDWVGVGPWQDVQVANAPHGVHQLTQLAASYASAPKILILDEPLAGLSTAECEHVAEILTELRQRGVSVILVEHQTRFVFSLCDEITVLAAGRVVATGSASDVLNNHQVRKVYLGQ